MRRCFIVALLLVSAIFVFKVEAASLVDNGNGTVTDNKTGLVWQKQDDGKEYNWYCASGNYHSEYNPTSLKVCGSLNLGGHSDWRLPSKLELQTILEYFWNTQHRDYWSSTPFDQSPITAWYGDFVQGKIYLNGYKGRLLYVRCVRGGM